MMHQEGDFRFLWVPPGDGEDDVGFRAVELLYVGEAVSMVLVVPFRDGALPKPVRVIDAVWLEARFADLDDDETGEVQVAMPRFTFGNDLSLAERLQALGMTTTF